MERNRLKELIQNQVEIKEALKEMWHNEDDEYKKQNIFIYSRNHLTCYVV